MRSTHWWGEPLPSSPYFCRGVHRFASLPRLMVRLRLLPNLGRDEGEWEDLHAGQKSRTTYIKHKETEANSYFTFVRVLEWSKLSFQFNF